MSSMEDRQKEEDGEERTRKGVFIYHRTSRRRRRTAAEKQSFRGFVDPASYRRKANRSFCNFFTQRQTKSLAFVDVIASAKHNETMLRNKKRIAGLKNRRTTGIDVLSILKSLDFTHRDLIRDFITEIVLRALERWIVFSRATPYHAT